MHYTKAEAEAIRVLVPHYKTALLSRDKQAIDDFFQRAYLVWFDYSPNFWSIDTKPDEWEAILECKRHVSIALSMYVKGGNLNNGALARS